MTRMRVVMVCVAVSAGALVLVAATAGERAAMAQSQSQGAVLVGTWYDRFPSGLSAFSTFHQDGTFATVRGHEFGGSPRPGSFRSNLRGSWRRVANHFESVGFSYNFDGLTGEATSIVRIRSVFALDPGFETLSGQFYVTRWDCADSVSCPDPLAAAPDGPEFLAATFTSARVPLP